MKVILIERQSLTGMRGTISQANFKSRLRSYYQSGTIEDYMTNLVKNHFDFWGIFEGKGTHLIKAIASNDLNHVHDYAKKVKLNEFFFGPGWSCMHYAAMLGRTDALSILLKNKGDIDIKTRHDETPLFMAVRHKHFDTVKKLLESGANPRIMAHHAEVHNKYYYQLSVLELARILKLPKFEKLIQSYLKNAKTTVSEEEYLVSSTHKAFIPSQDQHESKQLTLDNKSKTSTNTRMAKAH